MAETSLKTRRISTQIYAWIDEALWALENGRGQEVGWDAQFGFAEGEPFIGAYFAIPGSVEGTEVRTTVQFTNLADTTLEAVVVTVREIVDHLRAAREGQAEAADEDAGEAPDGPAEGDAGPEQA